MERWCPARWHSAVEGPAEAITVKGEAFISAALQPSLASPHLLEVLFGQQAMDLLTKMSPFGSLVSKLLCWNDQSSS